MMGNRWGYCPLVCLLLLATPLASSHAETHLYLYDASVAEDVDLDAYLASGTVRQTSGKVFVKYVDKGPAPADYPAINVSEQSFEQLGMSNAEIDGVWFLNHGNFYVPNRKALVLWTVRIPNASARTQAEFESDLTLSMWVDWNQDTMWREGERMIHFSFNLADRFPSSDDDIVVSYLTSFRVPDVTATMTSNAKYGNSGKDIRYMWVRAVVACDDPDMSADGDQLFGEYEDYRVAYYIENKVATDGGSR
ncbi:MAG TPA: GEVED domain-containing protein [Candidatus Krumholzibacteria bacterium]|nr:GEVED domain-containing protein [Candidatus Krumholzibacteria bacterium]